MSLSRKRNILLNAKGGNCVEEEAAHWTNEWNICMANHRSRNRSITWITSEQWTLAAYSCEISFKFENQMRVFWMDNFLLLKRSVFFVIFLFRSNSLHGERSLWVCVNLRMRKNADECEFATWIRLISRCT